MAGLFFCELFAYLTPKTTTQIHMDMHQRELIEIHFDITMHKLPCNAADVMVWDTFRETPLPIQSKALTKVNLDHVGEEEGVHEDDANILVHHEEEHPELDQDWDHTSEQFKRMHFQDVIRYHDFTFINFYAEWCVHCRKFAPIWKETEAITDKKKYKDADGNIVIAKLLRINCVDFPNTCRDAGIRWYPLYECINVIYHLQYFKGIDKEMFT
eukprot:UN30167